jgi:hypothetical protein
MSPLRQQRHRRGVRPRRLLSQLGLLVVVGSAATFAGGQAVKAGVVSTTTITSSAVPTHANVGADLTDSATLANTTSLDGTGTITFTLYTPGDATCASTPAATLIEGGIAGDGPFTSPAGSVDASVTGTYHWIASFSGDGGDSAAATACADEPVTITPDATISTTAEPSAAALGTTLQDSAILGNTTNLTGLGTITFNLYGVGDDACGSPLDTETVATGTSAATVSTTTGYTTAIAGTYEWTAAFSGDASNTAASTTCGEEPVVVTAHPGITSTAEPDSGPVGSTLQDSATLTGGSNFTAAGTIQFSLYGPGDTSCSTYLFRFTFGEITFDGPFDTTLSDGYLATIPGIYNWVAIFSGDGNNAGATTACGDDPVAIGGNPTITGTPDPAAGSTGGRLQESALLSGTESLQGTGAVMFNLYGPGDATCGTVIHTESVTGVASDGPFGTSTGFVAGIPGTYNWTATFTGDADNAPTATPCGAQPVVVTRVPGSAITSRSATCDQFSHGTAETLSRATYATKGGKVTSAGPGAFGYWLRVTSTGGSQVLSITQFTNETSRALLLSSSAVFSASCARGPATISQSRGTVTARFAGGSAGTVWYIGLRFSTANLVGEGSPSPNATVRYLFKSRGLTSEIDLVK